MVTGEIKEEEGGLRKRMREGF